MNKKASLAMLCMAALFGAVTAALADDPKYGSCLYTTQLPGTLCNQSGHSCTRTGPGDGDTGGSGSYTGVCTTVESKRWATWTCWCIEG